MFLKINIGFIVISGLIFCINAHGQTIVGMGTDNPNPNAVLELASKHQNQGFLMPRLTTSQRNASGFTALLSSKDNGLLVFDTDEGFFYYWYKDKWHAVGQGEYDGPTTIPVWLAGEAMPKDSEGKEGDFYLHQSTGNVYRKQENTFILIGNLQNQGLQYTAGTGIQITDQNEIVNTGDIDPANELQHLNLSGSTLGLSGSNTKVDLSVLQDGTGTDSQTLSLAGNNLSISGGNSVDISGINSDNQTLSLAGNNLSIAGGNNVDLSSYLDNTDSQNLSLTGNSLSISGGNSVDISSINTDSQTLSLAGNSLSISGGNNVDISSINTDSQNLSHSTTGQNVTLNISGGTGTTFSVADNDSDAFNELQDLNLSSNNLTITNNASATVIDLSPYLDNTDNQNLSLTGDSLSISDGNSIDISSINTDSQDLSHTRTGEDVTLNISGGTATTFSVADNDSDATNEVQDLTLSSHELTITNNASATAIDLSPYLDNTDNQNLSLTGDSLSISDGNSIDISSINTDSQDLSHTRTGEDVTLNISGGTATTFSVADNDSDATNEVQDLTLSSHALTITNNASATTVDLSTYLDNTDSQNLSHTTTGQNVTLNISGGTATTFSVADNDSDATNEVQDLSLSSHALTITNNASATTVDLSPYVDNTDSQNLSLTGDSLSISGGNSIDISSINTDSQDLSHTRTGEDVTLNISGGTATTFSVADNDSDATNEVQDLTLSSHELTITNNASATAIDLSPYLDNTDSQNLSHTRTGEDVTLNISGGTATTFSVADNDSSVSNETITNAALNVNTLEITEAGTTHTVDLSSIKGSTYTGGEGISVVGTTVVAKADSVTIGFDASQNLKVLDNGITDAQIANVAPSKLLAEGAADGDVLTYNSGSGKWESIAPSASTVTQYYSVDPTDFVSVNGASDMEYNGVNGGSASIAGGLTYMIAPIHLPHGAVITEVKFYVYNALLGLPGITCSLQSKVLGSEATTNHVTKSSGILVNIGDATLTATGLNITIDNSTNSYRIKAEVGAILLGLDKHKVYGARITYTETL